LVALLSSFGFVEAQAGEGAVATDCKKLVGTYLIENRPKGASAGGFTSRSLISRGGAHLALFTDSGQGGEAGFAPFTEGQGSWYCEPGDGGKLKVRVTTLDFTVPAGGSEGGIGRLDFDLAYDPAGETLKGTATLYLIPLAGDPLAVDALKDGRTFEVAGQRVKAP
jgi:hypothetical protein